MSHQDLGACVFPVAGGWRAASGRSSSQLQQQQGQGQRGLWAVRASHSLIHFFIQQVDTGPGAGTWTEQDE